MADFISMDFLELLGAQRELQNEKFLPTAGLELTTLGLLIHYRYC